MEIWRRQRYERILVDFLFRTRCFETAKALAKATGIEVRSIRIDSFCFIETISYLGFSEFGNLSCRSRNRRILDVP